MLIKLPELKGSKRKYIAVNIPKEWEPHLNEALDIPLIQKQLTFASKQKLPSSLGVWIIEQWLIENTSFRFEHVNTFEDHITIMDRKFPMKLFDLYPRDDGSCWCEEDDSIDCVHVHFVLEQHKIMRQLEQRGWKPKY